MRRRYMILTILCLAAIDPGGALAGDRFVALKTEYETKLKQREAEYEAAYAAAEKKGVRGPQGVPVQQAAPGSHVFEPLSRNRRRRSDRPRRARGDLDGSEYKLRRRCKALETRDKAFKLLREFYVSSPNIGNVVNRLARFEEDEAKAFVNDVIARNPDRAIQAKAYRAILNVCEWKADLAGQLQKNDKLREQAEKNGGKENVAKRINEGEKAKSEAERINKILHEKYPDIVSDLSIGAKMPALVSEDLEGKIRHARRAQGQGGCLRYLGDMVRSVPGDDPPRARDGRTPEGQTVRPGEH